MYHNLGVYFWSQ